MIEARQDAIQGIGFRIVSNRPEVSSMMDSPARAISDQHAYQLRRMREFLDEWRGSVRKWTHGCLEAVSPFGDELPDTQIWTPSGFHQIAAAQWLPATDQLNWTARSRTIESSPVGLQAPQFCRAPAGPGSPATTGKPERRADMVRTQKISDRTITPAPYATLCFCWSFMVPLR